MAGNYFIADALGRAAFAADKMTKQDCFASERLFVGLNCLTRGQSQRVHTHSGVDKFYLVLSGKARIRVGDERQELASGGIAWAPAGVPHGIEQAIEDCVVLVAMGPGPGSGETGKAKPET